MRKATLGALQALHEKHGLLRAPDVVHTARDSRSPLHRHFQWDNAKAGHAFRLHQARQLISVAVIVIGDRAPIRIFAHVRSAGPGYHRLDQVATSAALRTAYVQQLRDDVQSLREKYELYAEVLKRPRVGQIIGALEEELTDKQAVA